MRLGLEKLATGALINYLSETPYDSTKWNLGNGITYNNGGTQVDKYFAPQFNVIRPLEESTPFAVIYTYSYNFSPTIDYVFGIENSTVASATRRVTLWTVNKKSGSISWNGFITITLATATAHTVRDFKIDIKNESVGTIAVTGTTVTGTGTLFNTNRVALGARIGFGSTDPKLITTWYRITVKASDTNATLNITPGTIAAGTPYIIQEFRPIYTTTNATTTNGGIHYVKGISIDDFTNTGTTIPLATTIDDQKASYWIKDALTQTNIVTSGAAVDFSTATPTSLDCYNLDLVVAGNYKFYKYNLRAALVLTAGAATNAFILATGNNTFTGTGSQNSNLAIATTNHGTGLGVKSVYFVTTTRLYRVPTVQITNASTTVLSAPSDAIIEIPTGGVNTFPITNALSTVEYMSDTDNFVVGTSNNFSYVTQYVNSGQQFQKIFGRNYVYLEQSIKDNAHPSLFSNQGTQMAFNDSGNGSNLMYIIKQGTAGSTNHLYVMAFGADWSHASTTQGRLISPSVSTPNASKYYRAFLNTVSYLGNDFLGKTTEPIKLLARTANITTDTITGWAYIDETNDLSSFAGAPNIQFAVEFKTIGESCLPARILGVNMQYEDNSSLSNFQFSQTKSDAVTKKFSWRYTTAFGSVVPPLKIELYDAVTNGLLLTDNTAASTGGVFEISTDGISFSTWTNADKTNETTYLRYTPTSLADNINVRPIIKLN
jgi:hypothetical protein